MNNAIPVAVIEASKTLGLPMLKWISAEHSFMAPIGATLYAESQKPIASICVNNQWHSLPQKDMK